MATEHTAPSKHRTGLLQKVLGVLADFNFLHHFPEGGTIAGPVLPDDPDLLGAFSL